MAIQWINNLSASINQSSPGLSAPNELEISVNNSQAQLANWSHRNGADLFLDSISASGSVKGLHMYQKDTGVNYLHMVHNGNLYINGVTTWASQDLNDWDTASTINMTNHINRHYMASSTSGERLKYATETGAVTTVTPWTAIASSSSTASTLITTTDVFTVNMIGFTIYNVTDSTNTTIIGYTSPTTVTTGTAINDTWDSDTLAIYLDPKYLAASGAYMMMDGGTTFPRRAYITEPESDTIKLGSKYFVSNLPITGIESFGNGRNFIIFSRDGYIVADPQSFYNTPVDGYGCISHRSIKIVKNNLIYLGVDTFNALPLNASYPTDIAKKIKNDKTADALFNKIDWSVASTFASGRKGDLYWCAVQNLSATVKGQTINNAIFIIDTSQNSWRVDTYATGELASIMAEFTNSSGVTDLYAGSLSNGTVYKLDTPGLYSDDNRSGTPVAVTGMIRGSFLKMQNRRTAEPLLKKIHKIYLEYTSASPITVKYSINGSSTYTTLAETFPAYSTNLWTTNFFNFGIECFSISLQFECAGDYVIYAYGLDIDFNKGEGIKGL